MILTWGDLSCAQWPRTSKELLSESNRRMGTLQKMLDWYTANGLLLRPNAYRTERGLAAWGPAVTAASAEDGGLSRAAQFSRCDKRYLALQEFEKQLLPTAMRMMQPSSSFEERG